MLKPDTYLLHHKTSSTSGNDSPITSTSKILAQKRSCVLPAITSITPGVLSFHSSYAVNLLDKPTIQVNLRSSSNAKESFAAYFYTEMGNSEIGLNGSTTLPTGEKGPEDIVNVRNTNRGMFMKCYVCN
uniref:Cucumisin n=1 Tax=Parastrongyloides trichosuri TaxID=131310 RepID=A0A0N4ZFX7_PARTI